MALAQNHQYHQDSEILMEPDLSEDEKRAALEQLEKAKVNDYDFCVVTRNGIYVTKKIYP